MVLYLTEKAIFQDLLAVVIDEKSSKDPIRLSFIPFDAFSQFGQDLKIRTVVVVQSHLVVPTGPSSE